MSQSTNRQGMEMINMPVSGALVKAHDFAHIMKEGVAVVVDQESEKILRHITSVEPFLDAPHVVVDGRYEFEQSLMPERNVTQYGHRVWAVWNGLVYEANLDDQTIDRVIDHRDREGKTVLVGLEKPFTMPNGERSRQTQPKDR